MQHGEVCFVGNMAGFKAIPHAENTRSCWKRDSSAPTWLPRHTVLKEGVFGSTDYWKEKKNPDYYNNWFNNYEREKKLFETHILSFHLFFFLSSIFPGHFIYSAACGEASQSERLRGPRPRLSAELQMRFESWQGDYRKQMTYASNLWP